MLECQSDCELKMIKLNFIFRCDLKNKETIPSLRHENEILWLVLPATKGNVISLLNEALVFTPAYIRYSNTFLLMKHFAYVVMASYWFNSLFD